MVHLTKPHQTPQLMEVLRHHKRTNLYVRELRGPGNRLLLATRLSRSAFQAALAHAQWQTETPTTLAAGRQWTNLVLRSRQLVATRSGLAELNLN